MRKRDGESERFLSVDLLSWRPIRRVVLSPLFPLVFQVLVLAAVLAFVMLGLGLGTKLGPAELKLFRKTNLTTLVVWGLWWPGMIVVALLFGRAWCTVCPMELVHRLADTLARKVGWPRARLGAFLRAGWMTLALYFLLQVLVAVVSIHRVPHFTALMLLTLLGVAFLSGLIFRHPRSFCSAFCPVSALLSVYGRFTPFQLSHKQTSVCESCATRDCVRGQNLYHFDKRSCPSLIRPFWLEASDECVLCLQCVKVCPHDNMGLGLVKASAPIRSKALLRPFEAAFVMVVMGFVAHEVVGEAKGLEHCFHFVPERLREAVGASFFAPFEAAWFLVLFPLIVWSFVVLFARFNGYRGSARDLLLAAATGAAPIVAMAHFAKAVAKISSWGVFLPGALADPRGVETFGRLSDGTMDMPQRLIALSAIGWIMLPLILLMAWRALRGTGELPVEAKTAARSGTFATVGLFSIVLVVWILPFF